MAASFIEFLTSHGFINNDQKNVLEVEQLRSGKPVEQLLSELGILTGVLFLEAYAQYTDVRLYDPLQHKPDVRVSRAFPENEARKFRIFPLYYEEKNLMTLMVDPENIYAFDRLYHFFPDCIRICPLLCSESDVGHLIDNAYGSNMGELQPDQLESEKELLKFDAIKFVESVLEQAVKARISDIHFEPEERKINVRFRTDGILKQAHTLHSSQWSALCVRLKIIAGMDIAEARLPQDGRFSKKIQGRMVDFRMATHPTLYGENIVVRILDKHHSLKSLNELGFDAQQVTVLQQMITQPEGIIILTGPTGSGKTTTLYSLLQALPVRSLNIMTLEEPIEYEIPGLRQTEIKEAKGMTFLEGIRSILRQDPDVILVGEIRDAETAQMAVRAAMTGHLVLTTLHTNNCYGAIYRLKDLGLSPALIAGNLIGIVSQRLLRTVCTHCLGSQENNAHVCIHCNHSGFKGRMAVGEILAIDDATENIIAEERPIAEFKEYIYGQGFQDLSMQAQKLLEKGKTTPEEIRRVIRTLK